MIKDVLSKNEIVNKFYTWFYPMSLCVIIVGILTLISTILYLGITYFFPPLTTVYNGIYGFFIKVVALWLKLWFVLMITCAICFIVQSLRTLWMVKYEDKKRYNENNNT